MTNWVKKILVVAIVLAALPIFGQGEFPHPTGFVPIRLPDSLVSDQLPPRFRTEQLPAKFDWRNVNGHNYITSVKNQYYCNSCWAFAAVAQFESAVKIYSDLPLLPIDLSEQELVSCDTNYLGCEGGNFPYEYFALNGVVDEQCFPYDTSQTVALPCGNICPDAYAHRNYKLAVTYINTHFDINTIKQAVYQCPMFLGIMAYYSLTHLGPTDSAYIWCPDTADPSDVPAGGHAMLCIGWDDSAGCLIFKNSWGTEHADSGFVRISYAAFDLSFPKTVWYEPDSYDAYIFPVDTLYAKLVQNWECEGVVVRTETSYVPIDADDSTQIISPPFFSAGKFYSVQSYLWSKDLIDTALFGAGDGTTLSVIFNAPMTVTWECVETTAIATECLSDENIVAYPNPFFVEGEEINISFALCKPGVVDIRIYDAGYNFVRNLLSGEEHDSGSVVIKWDGRDEAGNFVVPGVYFVVIESAAGERGITKIVARKR